MNRRKKAKINNKGFTLIEVLITVAIIAVIVAPILTGIVTSMKVNRRSDELQNTTGVAQGIMESISGMSLEELAISLGGTSAPMDFLTMPSANDHMEILSASGGVSLPSCVTSTLNADGTYSYEFNKNSSNVYYFGIKDVEYDGKKYDVKVTLDARDYYNGAGAAEQGYNEVEYVDLSNYDEKRDGLYLYTDYDDNKIAQKIVDDTMAMGQNLTLTDVKRVGTRTMTIKITTEHKILAGGTDYPYTKAEITTVWEVPSVYVAEGAITTAVGDEITIFDNQADNTQSLRNLYVLYTPNYNSNITKSSVTDKIIIENNENHDVELFLVKQNDEEEATMKNKEEQYRMELRSECATTDGSQATKIRTNLGYNLHDLLYASDYSHRNVQVPTQCNLIFSNTYSHVETTKMGSDFYNSVSRITGTSQGNERMFTKTVEIWPKGSYDSGFTSGSAVATLSSKLQ